MEYVRPSVLAHMMEKGSATVGHNYVCPEREDVYRRELA
jgi:hypothetical protein